MVPVVSCAAPAAASPTTSRTLHSICQPYVLHLLMHSPIHEGKDSSLHGCNAVATLTRPTCWRYGAAPAMDLVLLDSGDLLEEAVAQQLVQLHGPGLGRPGFLGAS